MDDERLARSLAAVGSPTRLRLYRRIVEAGPAGIGPVALSDATGVQRTLVSYHLQPLVAAALVVSERRGRDVNYRLEPSGVARLAASLLALSTTRDDMTGK